MKKDLNDYLVLPYKTEIVPIAEDEGGGYLARLPQFGVLGIVGDGETKEQALADLARSQKERFQKYLDEGLEIPKPEAEPDKYSGRFLVRFPKYLHRGLSKAAKENGVSLNQYICTLLAMNLQSDRLTATITVMREEIQTLNQNIGTLKYQFKESYRFSKYDISAIHADEYPQAA